MSRRPSQGKNTLLKVIADEIAVCAACRKDAVGLPVPGEGSADAKVAFIGEAPGKQEAATGRPFVGRSGKVLRQMIREVGLREEEVFITSALKYLPKHVTPKPKEIAHARKHLLAQLDIIHPKIIVLMGRAACFSLLERDVVMTKEHGMVAEKNGRRFFLMYHPAAVLYAQRLREDFVNDFTKLRSML